jgi:hypothetical protein
MQSRVDLQGKQSMFLCHTKRLLRDVDILGGTSKQISLLSQFQGCMCSVMDIECIICQCSHESGLTGSKVLWSQMH